MYSGCFFDIIEHYLTVYNNNCLIGNHYKQNTILIFTPNVSCDCSFNKTFLFVQYSTRYFMNQFNKSVKFTLCAGNTEACAIYSITTPMKI